MVEAKTQLLWSETRQDKKKIGRNRGIPKTQLGFSLDQKKEKLHKTVATYKLLLLAHFARTNYYPCVNICAA